MYKEVLRYVVGFVALSTLIAILFGCLLVCIHYPIAGLLFIAIVALVLMTPVFRIYGEELIG
jgi:hypothetical protein